jgi:predicted RND superfamily exporter protein
MSHAHDIPDGVVIRDIADFDTRSGTLPERLLFNNRLVIVVLCALISAVLGYKALGLSLNAAFEKMIPTKHPYIVNFLENRGQLAGMGNSLRIAIEAKKR